VNRSTKLLLAAALLATGYGLASLLGTPTAPYALRSGLTELHGNARAATPVAHSDNSLAAVGSVRLLPAAMNPSPPAVSAPKTSATAPTLPQIISQSFAPGASSNRSPALQPSNDSYSDTSDHIAKTGERLTNYEKDERIVRARFGGAPPRSLANGDLSEIVTTTPSTVDSPTLPIGVGDLPKPPVRLPEVPAIYRTSIAAGPATQQLGAFVAAPQMVPEAPALRTHIITDGDSLKKLARRYLNDPERGDEIFSLNRDLLANPELLPIGTELKIPAIRASGRGG
jgi:nucleoid-associated protein YgaU